MRRVEKSSKFRVFHINLFYWQKRFLIKYKRGTGHCTVWNVRTYCQCVHNELTDHCNYVCEVMHGRKLFDSGGASLAANSRSPWLHWLRIAALRDYVSDLTGDLTLTASVETAGPHRLVTKSQLRNIYIACEKKYITWLSMVHSWTVSAVIKIRQVSASRLTISWFYGSMNRRFRLALISVIYACAAHYITITISWYWAFPLDITGLFIHTDLIAVSGICWRKYVTVLQQQHVIFIYAVTQATWERQGMTPSAHALPTPRCQSGFHFFSCTHVISQP